MLYKLQCAVKKHIVFILFMCVFRALCHDSSEKLLISLGCPESPDGTCLTIAGSHLPVSPTHAFTLSQRFSTGMPHGFLKRASPNYPVRGPDLFSLRLLNKK